jgi:uncharacterized membrane protein
MNSDVNSLFLRYPVIVIIFIIGYIVPFLTKNNIIFGSRVPDESIDSPQVQQLKWNYKHLYLILNIPILAILMFLIYSIDNELVMTLGILLQLLLLFYLLALFNHKTKKIKKSLINNAGIEEDQLLIIDTSFREGKYLVPIQWFLPSVLIVICDFIYIAKNFDKIPALIPTNFDFSGRIIRLAVKSNTDVYSIAFISLFNLLLFLCIYFVIKRSKQDLNGSFPKKALLQDRQFRYMWSACFAIISFILCSYFAVISLHVDRLLILSDKLFTSINIAFPICLLISAVFLAVKTGQSGSRLKVAAVEEEIKHHFMDDDINWKLGMIYYNPDDPSIFVPKRMGIGWTLNFGHTFSFILIGALIVIPIILKKR